MQKIDYVSRHLAVFTVPLCPLYILFHIFRNESVLCPGVEIAHIPFLPGDFNDMNTYDPKSYHLKKITNNIIYTLDIITLVIMHVITSLIVEIHFFQYVLSICSLNFLNLFQNRRICLIVLLQTHNLNSVFSFGKLLLMLVAMLFTK